MKKTVTLLAFFLLTTVSNVLNSQTVSTFENLTLNANSYWNGASNPLGTSFMDGNSILINYYDTAFGGYWSSGWAYSNIKDSTTAGMGNMYSSRSGGGYDGSSNYVVGQVDPYNQVFPKIILSPSSRGKIVSGAYFTNATYPAISMRDGDSYGKKFGGSNGDDPDWFKIIIKKWHEGVLGNDSVEFYLADFRSTNNLEDYILTNWQWVDLSTLGNVDSLVFNMSSSDVGTWGINTPLFFCMDNFTTLDQGVNIDLSENQPKINIYPNPAQEKIYINLSNNDNKTIQLYNQLGEIEFYTSTMKTNTEIDITKLKPGIYYLLIKDKNSTYSQKIIKR